MAEVEIIDQENTLPFGAKLDMNAKGYYQVKISIHGEVLDDIITQAVAGATALQNLAIKQGLPIQPVEAKK